MLIRAQFVQLSDQLHVLFDDTLVLLCMLFCLLLQFFLECLDVVFNLGALLVVNLIYVSSSRVIYPFIKHPRVVKAYYTFFEFLVREICFRNHLVNVIFKVLLNVLLSLNLLLHLLCRLHHSFLAHAQVVDDKN